MRYFVFGEDDTKFGPAEPPLLNQWIKEGRLLPHMTLEEEGSRHRVIAASVAELDFYSEEGAESPTPSAAAKAVAITMPATDYGTAAGELALSYAMAVCALGLSAVSGAFGFFGVLCSILGLVSGVKAKERSEAGGSAALIVNVVALVVWVASRIYFGST